MSQRYLPSQALFSELTAAQIANLTADWTRFRAPDQTILHQAGQAGETLFGIVEGQVLLCDADHGQVKHALGAGAFFGEMSLLDLSLEGGIAKVNGAALLYVLSYVDVLAWQQGV